MQNKNVCIVELHMVKVGLVDNDPDSLDIMNRFLSYKGNEIVYSATNSQEAITKNRENPAQVIIFYERILYKEGVGAVNQIHSEHPRTKFIFFLTWDKKPFNYTMNLDESSYTFAGYPGSYEYIVKTINRLIKDENKKEEKDNKNVNYKKKYKSFIEVMRQYLGDELTDEMIERADKMK